MISILQYILYAYASVISSRDMVCIGICSDCRLGESQRNEVAVESIWPGLLNIGNVREGCDGEGCGGDGRC